MNESSPKASFPPFATPSGSRSRNMAAMRSTDTKPEMQVRRALHRAGFRYRLHRADLPGKPDLVLPRFRIAVLVHGCFFHGHDCSRTRLPRTNAEYWKAKISYNRQRDVRNEQRLLQAGWEPFVIWQCQLDDGIGALIDKLKRIDGLISAYSGETGVAD